MFAIVREPLLNAKQVIQLGEPAKRFLLTQRLLSYLKFTSFLERNVVNPAVLSIADGTCGFFFDKEMRLNADKIYTDEGWHAQFSNDLANQVQVATNIIPLAPQTPHFFQQYSKLAQSSPKPELTNLIFAVVSETLISSTLSDIPNDTLVVTAVRDELRDHAKDEVLHHRFFSDVLRQIWHQIPPPVRRELCILVPSLIKVFLADDQNTAILCLRRLGLDARQSEDLVQAEYSATALQRNISQAGRATVALFRECGAFEEKTVAAAFEASGFL